METDTQLSENTTINIMLMKEILCFINNSLIAIIKENITPEKQKTSKIYRNTCNKLFVVFVYQIVWGGWGRKELEMDIYAKIYKWLGLTGSNR